MPKQKLAQYEWADKTGLRHPSLVIVDTTRNPLTPHDTIHLLPVLAVKRIESFKDVHTPRMKLNTRVVHVPKGYKFAWWDYHMNTIQYAAFVGVMKREGE